MRVYLVRHGEARRKEEDPGDISLRRGRRRPGKLPNSYQR